MIIKLAATFGKTLTSSDCHSRNTEIQSKTNNYYNWKQKAVAIIQSKIQTPQPIQARQRHLDGHGHRKMVMNY